VTNFQRRRWEHRVHKARASVLATALAFAAMAGAAAQTTGDLKTIKIVVGFSPGGVQNLPGAAGLKAVQYLDAGVADRSLPVQA
jgi:hypothetical protein